jgi:hypothetical protein
MTTLEAADRLDTIRNLLLRVERSDRMSKVDSQAIHTARKGLEQVAMYLYELTPGRRA